MKFYDYGVIDGELVLPLTTHALVSYTRTGKVNYSSPMRTLFYPASYDHLTFGDTGDYSSPLCPQWFQDNPDKKVIFSDNWGLKESIEKTLGGGPFDQSLYTSYSARRVAFSNIHPVIFSYQPSKSLNFEVCRHTIESYIRMDGWVIVIGEYSREFIESLNGCYMSNLVCDRSQWQCSVKKFWDKNSG